MMAEETSEKFRREIDLGDGRGVTVYEADTAEGLADKILEAQRNASVHIRRVEQENRELRAARAVPETPAPEFKRRELTADEQFEIGRNLQDPTKASGAVRQLMEAEFGAPVETVRSTLRTAAMIPGEIKGRDAAEVFLMNHPEIKTNGPNAKYFAKYMAGKRLAWTVQNLETAYADPELRGLLELGAAASPTTTNGNGNSAAAAGTRRRPVRGRQSTLRVHEHRRAQFRNSAGRNRPEDAKRRRDHPHVRRRPSALASRSGIRPARRGADRRGEDTLISAHKISRRRAEPGKTAGPEGPALQVEQRPGRSRKIQTT